MLEEPSGWIEAEDVLYDFFGHGLFFCGGVFFSVGGVSVGGDKGAEAFVSGVGGNVDTGAIEDVFVRYNDGGFAVLLMLGWVTDWQFGILLVHLAGGVHTCLLVSSKGGHRVKIK